MSAGQRGIEAARARGPALVTGASEGIGRALAEVFARNGHPVVLTARNAERLESLAAELRRRHGVAAHCLPLDLALPEAPAALYRQVAALGLEIDYLVNNAGFGLYGEFLAREEAAQADLVQVNIAALTRLCHLFGAGMAARGRGGIMNVASVVAFLPGPMMATYFASKAYVQRFSEALAEEFAGSGVAVCCLCPGRTESRFQERSGLAAVNVAARGLASAEAVAEAGYRGLMAGRPLVLPGLRNALIPWVERLVPRFLLRKAVYAVMRRRR